jgi:excisionase family DNA binding protein
MAVRRKSLSTGDIARYCQVTPATVVNWIKANKLDVYTTPGGQYRMEVEEFTICSPTRISSTPTVSS